MTKTTTKEKKMKPKPLTKTYHCWDVFDDGKFHLTSSVFDQSGNFIKKYFDGVEVKDHFDRDVLFGTLLALIALTILTIVVTPY